MKRVFGFFFGLLVVAAVGGGLVLLFTPQSGEDVKRMIQEQVHAVRLEGERAAETRRLELTAQLETLKQPAPKA